MLASLSLSIYVRINRRRATNKEEEAGVICSGTDLGHPEPGGTPSKQPIATLETLQGQSQSLNVTQQRREGQDWLIKQRG